MTALPCYYLNKNDFAREDSIILAVEDFITWCSLGFRYRTPGGNLFRVLSTCRIDAIKVFGSVDEMRFLVQSFNLDTASRDNLFKVESIIRDYLQEDNAITNACGIVGLLSYAAEYWGGENHPNHATACVISLLYSILSSRCDLALIKSAVICRLKRIMQ
ncbi:hypothetical protein [Hypsugopox virus]|nr:hypothetical protein [Hypsugopox virus]